jgi:ComF family protein
MSIFSTARSLRLPKISALGGSPWAWPQDCVLCLATSADRVCLACAASLARSDGACARCALPSAGAPVCGACARRPPRFDAARACFEYRFPVDRLVQRFKFAGDLAVGRWLAGSMASVLPRGGADLLVVPPLSRARLRSRGFNQSLELARPIARALGIAVDARALVKLRETDPQPGLGRAQRLRNLRGAFACDADLRGLHVAIVDDVLTTGATAQELSRVLKGAGAARVSVWAAARALPGA